MWSLVAVLNFPKNCVFFTLGAYSSCPTWARDPQKSSKRYISGLFEKSVPNMVTYLCKVLSKLHFPEGNTYKPPPGSYRVNQNIDYLGKKKFRGFLLALKDQIKNSEINIFFTNCIGFPTIYNTCLYIAVLYVFSGFILDTPKISVTFVSLRVSF